MYLPRHYEVTELPALHALIEAHPLGTWVLHAGGELVANHIPFLLDPTRGEFGTLCGHVARANPAWEALAPGVPSLVVFQGTDAYVTPSWYAAKQEHGRVVPTWNYATVHANGTARAIEDADWLRAHVSLMSGTQERHESAPWAVTDAPPEFIEKMLTAIVGIEIPIARLVGKWKVSQNRDEADRQGVIAGLARRGGDAAAEMAKLVRERKPD